MRNLFIELHECRVGEDGRRFGSGWEDLFTDQLAFFLSCDLAAASALAAMLLGDGAARVADVEVQPSTEDGRPDLALNLDDERTLFVENKVDAALQPQQLERYLEHGLVALVSRRTLSVREPTLEHMGYLQPRRGEHWTWEDVFRALPLPEEAPAGHGALREAFRSYMRELGFAPTNLSEKWRRLFDDRTEKENRRVQKEFGRLLNAAKSLLRRAYGFRVTDVSHKGKMAYAPEHASWQHLYVHPVRLRSETVPGEVRAVFEPGYEALTVEVVYDEDRK